MPQVNIPLEALTSRLNISEFSSNLTPSALQGRLSNLRPLSDFFDFRRLSKPGNFGEVQTRVNYNLAHFSSNYTAIALMLAVYAIISNKLLIFDIVWVSTGMFIIRRLQGRDLDLGFTKLTTSQLYGVIMIVAIPVFFLAGPMTFLVSLIGGVVVTIFGHASFMDMPIESSFGGEAV